MASEREGVGLTCASCGLEGGADAAPARISFCDNPKCSCATQACPRCGAADPGRRMALRIMTAETRGDTAELQRDAALQRAEEAEGLLLDIYRADALGDDRVPEETLNDLDERMLGILTRAGLLPAAADREP